MAINNLQEPPESLALNLYSSFSAALRLNARPTLRTAIHDLQMAEFDAQPAGCRRVGQETARSDECGKVSPQGNPVGTPICEEGERGGGCPNGEIVMGENGIVGSETRARLSAAFHTPCSWRP